MKRKIILSSLLVASALFSKDIDLAQFQELEIIKQSNMVVKKAKEIGDNWYYLEAINRGTKIGVYTDKNKVIIGRGFYSETGQEIKFDIDVKKYKENAIYTMGTGKHEYFLFTDPECPYCKMLDDKLANEAVGKELKIYTYLYPLEFHMLGNAMSIATISQAKEKRAEYMTNIMKKSMPEIIKEVDKFSSIFYKDLMNAIDDPRYSTLIQTYSNAINQAYGLKLNGAADIKKHCEQKLSKAKDSRKVENELFDSLKLTSEDFDITATPMMFDASGNKVENPFLIFSKHGIADIAPIKEIEKMGMTIQMGDKTKEKLYIFSSTKCPYCIQSFGDKEIMKKLEKYNVHFILMDTGSDPKLAQKEAEYLYGITDNTKRFAEFKRIMEGGTVAQDILDKPADASMQNKQKLYAKYITASMVQSTPIIIDSTGKIVENLK